MAVQKISNALLYCLAADTKPTTYPTNTLCYVVDTGDIYRWNGSWVLLNGASKTETLTGKTISGASNTISNIADGSLSSNVTLLNASQNVTELKTFTDGKMALRNPANTYSSIIKAGAQVTADKIFTFPVASSDTIALVDASQTLTTKTINASNNTITDTSAANGDLLVYATSKFVRKAVGTALQVLRTNSSANNVEWASLNSENTGKAVASGDGSTTIFNIAHGLGSDPAEAMVNCSSLTTTFTYTTNSTNIVVTFSTAPPSASNNVVIYWRAVA